MPGTKRKIARFFLVGCGVRYLHNSKIQRFISNVIDEIDLQHLRDSNPCRQFDSRKEFYSHLNNEVLKNCAIDYLEFGVFQGESINFWRTINLSEDSRFYGFDSFEGLPENWRESQKKGAFNADGNIPKIDDQRVSFIKGWFDKTVEEFAARFRPKNRLVIHLDADL
jgi:O-methyltransferase